MTSKMEVFLLPMHVMLCNWIFLKIITFEWSLSESSDKQGSTPEKLASRNIENYFVIIKLFLSLILSRFNHSIKDWRFGEMWLFALCQVHSTEVLEELKIISNNISNRFKLVYDDEI
jgi:hypothetical protein